jgi:hypothetical protein
MTPPIGRVAPRVARARLSVSLSELQVLVRAGRLQARRFGSVSWVSVGDVDGLMAANGGRDEHQPPTTWNPSAAGQRWGPPGTHAGCVTCIARRLGYSPAWIVIVPP